MSGKLFESLQRALGLDDESIGQVVSRAESLSGSELEQFLGEILGPGSAVTEEYLTSRGLSSGSGAQSSRQSGRQSGRQSAPRSGSSTPSRSNTALPELNSNNRLQHGVYQYSKGAWDPNQNQTKKTKQGQKSKSSSSQNKVKVDSLKDIEQALKQLELASRDQDKRKLCNCRAMRHGLFEFAPNCLNCGKIICVKEGLGPCLECGTPLVSNEQMANITQILRQEKDHIASTMGRKAREAAGLDSGVTVSQLGLKNYSSQDAVKQAQDRLNQLLEYQDTAAQRTRIVDQYSDFETPDQGLNQWASPLEQAQQLKRQQKQMRKLEQQRLAMSGRGKKVVSIDLKGNKIYAEERDVIDDESDDSDSDAQAQLEEQAAKNRAKVKSYWSPAEYGKNFIKPTYSPAVKQKIKANKYATYGGGVVAMDDDDRALEM